MELFKERIRQLGEILNDQVLKLDAILNHQVDPELIMALGKEFADRFRNEGVNKVITLESSGISIAFATAYELKVPMVFARRKKSLTADTHSYCERVPSFTKGFVTDIVVSKEFLTPSDRLLLIDDIIANGDAAKGLIRIIQRSGAELVGMGVAVEKQFQDGARSIREMGIRVDSLVRIARMDNDSIDME